MSTGGRAFFLPPAVLAGTGPVSSTGSTSNSGPKGTSPTKPNPKAELAPDAHTAGGRLVLDQMPDEKLRALQDLRREHVINVTGKHDHIDSVLKSVDMPFTSVERDAVTEVMLGSAKVIFVNCGGNFNQETIQRIAAFVEQGGLCITTDWALKELVQIAFPGFIKYDGGKTTGGNECVVVSQMDSDNPMIAHFASQKGGKPVWFLEASSYPISRWDLRGRDARFDEMSVLAYSDKMKAKYGHGMLAVSFPWGAGQVVHFVSHLYLQQNAMTEDQTGVDGASSVLTGLKKVSQQTQTDLTNAEVAGVTANEVASTATSMGVLTHAVTEHLTRGGRSDKRAKPQAELQVVVDNTPPKAASRVDTPATKGKTWFGAALLAGFINGLNALAGALVGPLKPRQTEQSTQKPQLPEPKKESAPRTIRDDLYQMAVIYLIGEFPKLKDLSPKEFAQSCQYLEKFLRERDYVTTIIDKHLELLKVKDDLNHKDNNHSNTAFRTTLKAELEDDPTFMHLLTVAFHDEDMGTELFSGYDAYDRLGNGDGDSES